MQTRNCRLESEAFDGYAGVSEHSHSRFWSYAQVGALAAAPLRLNNAPVVGGIQSGGFQPTRDGYRVIYRGDLTGDEIYELYSASTSAAGTQIKLSTTPVTGGDVDSIRIRRSSGW